jgi:hypothetical protein
MQDAAPAHFNRAVRDVLTNTYHDRWIGSEGLTAWPPRSPGVNSGFLPVGISKIPC